MATEVSEPGMGQKLEVKRWWVELAPVTATAVPPPVISLDSKVSVVEANRVIKGLDDSVKYRVFGLEGISADLAAGPRLVECSAPILSDTMTAEAGTMPLSDDIDAMLGRLDQGLALERAAMDSLLARIVARTP